MSKNVHIKTGKDTGRFYEPVVKMATIGGKKPSDQKVGILKHRLHPTTPQEKSDKSETSEKLLERSDSSDKSHSIMKPLTPLKGKRLVAIASNENQVKVDDDPLQRRLHFDFVGGATDPRTRAELSILMDTLLGRSHDCCLIHFNNIRRCQKNFLHNLLVTEVERRLQLVQSKLLCIELGYYDVRKHENFNVFGPLEKVIHKFRTLQQLLKWLRLEYHQLWCNGRWHEFFKFKFNFLDAHQREHCSQFDFIQIYLAKMDRNTKWHLCQLVRNGINTEQVRKGKKTGGYALLTEDLRKYFDGTEPWFTSIVFDVSHSGGKITNTMLELANAAYDGLKTVQHKVEVRPCIYSQVNCQVNSSSALVPRPNKYITKSVETVAKADSQDSFLSALGTDTEIGIPRGTSKQHSSELSADEITEAWIIQIDERFSNVFKTWRDYYDCKHDHKICKVCKDIKCMSATAESVEKPSVADKTNDQHVASNVEWHYNNYKQAQAKLRQLMQDVDEHAKSDTLKPYMVAKAQELHEVTVRHKVKQLQLCKSRVVSIITQEISALRL